MVTASEVTMTAGATVGRTRKLKASARWMVRKRGGIVIS